MSKGLKAFMQDHFDFSSMKKSGVYPKDMKHTDYEGQAKIICLMFDFKSVYEYAQMGEVRCHISYAGERPMEIDENGNLKTIPFIEVSNINSLHITEDERVPPTED